MASGIRSLFVVLFASLCLFAQPQGAVKLKLSLDRLRTLGSVLMVAAHPDDENTALLAYFAQGRHLRTGYLSLTRGEGGQNLIGSEQGAALGVIRTHELLAARRIDGAEQFFTRAIDFGFSKTAEETLAKWGRDRVLADVVWTIRRFRPDVIVLRFSGTPRDGHGHHQSSAILAKEAFEAAADPARFPEHLKVAQPWKAKRIMWNFFAFTREAEREAAGSPGRIEVDTGEFSSLLGVSYGEIAAQSRSMHRSQAMGSAERRGSQKNYLTLVAGEPARGDVFDGIDITWNRLPGGGAVAAALDKASAVFDLDNPTKLVPALVEARSRIAAIDHPLARQKLVEADELIAAAAGLWMDATVAHHTLAPGAKTTITVTALRRSKEPAKLLGVDWSGLPGIGGVPESELAYNEPLRKELPIAIPEDAQYTQPYWLREPPEGAMYRILKQESLGLPESPPAIAGRFRLRIAGAEIAVERAAVHRWVDPVRGELSRSFEIAPPVSVEFSSKTLLFPSREPRRIELQVRSVSGKVNGDLALELPSGWRAAPAVRPFQFEREGETAALVFEVTPPDQDAAVELGAVARVRDAAIRHGVDVIRYDHIPPQMLLIPARVSAVRTAVKLLSQRVGYVMGPGDEVPDSLRQMGADVLFLESSDLVRGDLSRYDAIVTGVRAFNTRPDLRANMHRLLEYVQGGGTLVVQYNVLEGGFREGNPRALDNIGPWPIKFGRDRVSVEEAPMVAVSPDHPLLQAPNRITAADYQGWIQERGLYFAADWDKRYQPIWTMHDPGEPPRQGSTLYARYGKGAFVFTALSWFRQLPAGVPGAYRIFANLLSAGKVTQ
jgi:LmbE family N-acetylglucosaminyl deacetylase